MIAVLRLLWDVCLFKRGPQDLPYSPALARALLLVQAGLVAGFLGMIGAGRTGVLQMALSLTLAVALPWAVLRARGHEARFVQTLTALIGSWIFATVAYLPLAWIARDFPMPEPGMVPTRMQALVTWGTMILVAWKLAINAQIWRQALEWPVGGGVALAIGVFLFELGVLRLIVPT